jgi:hypothetical protein
MLIGRTTKLTAVVTTRDTRLVEMANLASAAALNENGAGLGW